MKKISTTLLIILLTSFFLGGTAIRVKEFSPNVNLLILINGLFIIVLTLIIKKRNIVIRANSFTILYSLLVLFLIISSLNSSGAGFMLSMKFILIYIVFMVCLPNLPSVFTFKVIAISFIISSSFVLLLSVIKEPPDATISGTYSGIFANSNSLGLLTVTLFSLILVLFISNLFYKLNVKKGFLLLIILLFLLLIISISSSRTSFVTAVFLVVLALSFYVLKTININSININYLLQLSFILIFLGISIFIFLKSDISKVIDENIVSKFSEKSSGNMSSGRSEIWIEILDSSKLIGESDYFKNENNPSAHNTFLSNIGHHGWVQGIIYIIFWLNAMIQSFIYFKNNSNIEKYAIFPFLSVSTFIILSMTEVLTFNGAELLALSSIGYAFFKTE